MDITDAEAKGFWPIYDSYQKDLQQINERIVKGLNAYAAALKKGPLPDAVAKRCSRKWWLLRRLRSREAVVHPEALAVVPAARSRGISKWRPRSGRWCDSTSRQTFRWCRDGYLSGKSSGRGLYDVIEASRGLVEGTLVSVWCRSEGHS